MNTVNINAEIIDIYQPVKKGNKLCTVAYLMHNGYRFNDDGKKEKTIVNLIIEIYGTIGKKIYDDYCDRKINKMGLTGFISDRVRENIPIIIATRIVSTYKIKSQ